MVTLLLDSTQLEVSLSGAERALSFRREPVRIARDRIRKVQLTDDAWTWIRGSRSAGTLVRGVLAMGTWKTAGGADFVIVRRHRAAVVIDLAGDPEFERVVLTTRHGNELVRALRLQTDATPTDVVDIVTGAIALPREDAAR
ncbi:hypothetical protein [Microbacterium sp. No. 7]|uniref:hypothetical protein n=1 Tax=Microbacterium sp. No. 7 TaxID=1714373 RepID=UPI0006CF985F|nr:hypothetical protein [Microbacterium sp. No. 7]ALJ21730.1 hypothetical protein AOA12_18265 [Microbacterium sp. No. 7]